MNVIEFSLRQQWWSAALFIVFSLVSAVTAANIERVEPAFWWVGMQQPRVQLMVHGDKIASASVTVNYPGVQIERVTPSDNPNYLFIDLNVSPSTKPGNVDVQFVHNNTTSRYSFPLLARENASAQRQGFNNRDVILNIVPDRFANGDSRNDRVAGYIDKVDRNDDAAGRHGGDIQGIINHLDYIADMGYTMLWPIPLTESNQAQYSYHGYAATDIYKIDPRYGSNDDYRRMVSMARQKGIGVILDFVPNHIGSQHWWMRDKPMKDWINFPDKFVGTEHRRTTASDPYAMAADRDNFTQGWFVDTMPDLNQKNPFLATYLIQNCIWWIEYAGLAGVRIDTYGYSDHSFLAQWSKRLREEYPNLNFVGEEWSTNPVIVSYWLQGKDHKNGYRSWLPSVMDFPLNDTLRRALVAKESMHTGFAELYEALANDTLYPQPHNLVLFEGNHDVSRLYSALDEDLALYKMALTYVLTLHRIPQMYYGTEILMTSTKHRDDGAFRRDFPGGWPADKVNAFTGQGLSASQREAQAFVKKILNWRKKSDAVHNGELRHYTPVNGVYVYFRYSDKQRVMVVLNKNFTETHLSLERFQALMLNAKKGIDVVNEKTIILTDELVIAPRSAIIIELMP